jgi:hypothetical protein
MIGRRVGLFALSFACLVGSAEAASLSEAGTDLGRVNGATLPEGLSVAVELGGIVPQGSFLIARFQDNPPLMKASDGLWQPWDGDTATLVDAGAVASADSITFPIVGEFAADFSFPVVFTIGVKTESGPRSAFIAVDGP